MSTLSTHVLDAVSGTSRVGLPAALERRSDGSAWAVVGRARTDEDGPGSYAEVTGASASDEERRYHVPLLLSPFACSTYRGS